MGGCRESIFTGGWGWLGVTGGTFWVAVVGWSFLWVDGAG